MRLIDADNLKELYKGFGEYEDNLVVPIKVVLQNIDDMPTAYDTYEAIKQYEIGFDDGFEQASEIDLQELKKQIKNGDFRTFINNGKVYMEDVIDGEAIMIYELKTGE